MKKILCILLVCALCCGLLCGCSEEDNAFVCAVSGVPDTLDPQLADSDVERILAANLFEGLFRLDAEGQPVQAACESYTVSGDGLVWTFRLREGMTYYLDPEEMEEGCQPVPVTADDYVFALQRLFLSGSNPYRQDFLDLAGAEQIVAGESGVENLGVYAVGEYTLMLRLVAPDEDLPRRLCCAGAMPCNRSFYEETEGTYGLSPASILTNGIFRLTLWSEENGATLRRVTPKETLVNKVRLIPAQSLGEGTESAVRRLEEGLTDGEFIAGVPENDETALFCVCTQQLLFNCANRQLASADVRAGLAGVVYRSLPQQLPEGMSSAGGLVPESVTLGGDGWRQLAGSLLNEALPEDAAEAYRRGLSELGREKLSGITVLVPDTEEWHTLYAAVSLGWQQQLSAFFSVEYLPEEELLRRVADGSFDLAFVTSRVGRNDVAGVLAEYTSGEGGRILGYEDPALEALLADTRLTVGQQSKAEVLRAAELQLLRGWPVVPIATMTEYYATAEDFTGVAASPFGPVLDFTWAGVVQRDGA